MKPVTFVFSRLVLCLVLGLLGVCLAGCHAKHYQLILNNGAIIETKGKPKLDTRESVYTYKEVSGRKGTVPVVGVREIAPR